MTSPSTRTGRAVLVGIVAGVLHIYGTAFSQDSGKSGPAVTAATPDSRLACPPDAKVEEAVELIRAAYEAAYDKSKDTSEPDPLIEQLTSLANQTTDSAKKYALLLEAETVATQYENYATALDLLARRAEQFQIDGLKLKGQLLKRLAGPRVAADLVLFDHASDTAEQAMQAERFDVAAEAAALAVSVAKAIDREQKAEAKKRGRAVGRNGKDESRPTPIGPGLVKKATAFQSRVTSDQKLFTEYEEALTRIKSQPDDAAANSIVAKYLCFVRGEWQKGLPALAKSEIESLKDVATKEIALSADEKRDAKRVFELAGAWWSASESKRLTDDQESSVKDHAAGFYAEVLENLSDVLEKQLATSRLRGLAAKQDILARAPVFLSDMPVKRSLVGWDRLRMGRIPDLRINGDSYDKVIKADASSIVAFDLPDGFSGSLRGRVAIAGLSREISPPSSCRFRILGGENLLWESGVIAQDKTTGLSVVEQFNVNLKDVKTITLEVDSLGANHSDWSVWIDPVLLWQGTTLSSGAESSLALSENANEKFEFNGHTYWFPKKQTNQIEARLSAEKVGGTLVVIDDDDENNFVAKHIRGTSWIGVRKSPSGLMALSGGGDIAYSSWDKKAGQPSNFAGETAVATNPTGLWHDHFATDELYYVVEWPRTPPRQSAAASVAGNPVQPDPGTLMRFRGSISKTLSFNVVGSVAGGSVWGSNPYTADSQLARAAVHAGVLKPGESGVVNVTILPGQQSYDGTARNGVTTSPWGSYSLSYRIESDATASASPVGNGISVKSESTPSHTIVYLSDLPELEAKVVHFGFGKGTIRGGQNPIRSIIDGKESPHGLSMHPGDGPNGDCFVRYKLPKGIWRFSATTTLDQGGSFKHCGIGFEVIADGKSVWKSKTIDKNNRFEECDVAIGDCTSLELRTYTATAAFGGHAVWIEPRITPAAEESKLPQAGLDRRWLEGLEVNQLQTRYWRVVSAGVQGNVTLDVYNDDEGRGRCPAFLGGNGNYSGQFWDLREPGLMSNLFLGPSRVLSVDASGEVFMGSRQQQQDVFWTTRNPDGRSFKIQTRGGYLSVEEKMEGRDVSVFVSTNDQGNRSNWLFVPTDRLIVHSDPNQP